MCYRLCHYQGILDMQQMLDKLLDTGSNPKKGSLSSAGSNASSQQQYIEVSHVSRYDIYFMF